MDSPGKAAFLLMSLMFCASTEASTCRYAGKFTEYTANDPVVVRATVAAYGKELPGFPENYPRHYYDMRVSVTDVVRGHFSRDELTLFGDTGMSTLRYVSETDYPLGSEHLFALTNNDDRHPLRGCGESSLRIVGDRAEGRDLNRKPQEYSLGLQELLETLREE